MKFIEVIRESRAKLAAETDTLLAEANSLDDKRTAYDGAEEERAAFETGLLTRGDEIIARLKAIKTEDGPLAEREAELAEIEERQQAASIVPTTRVPGAVTPIDTLNYRDASASQLSDALTRSLEPMVEDPANMAHVRKVLQRHLNAGANTKDEDRAWARNLIARTTETYRSAWSKVMTGGEMFLTNEERASLAVGTNTQGGYLVPTHLDPTIILTNSGTSNAIRAVSRVVTLTEGSIWQGVTSAGVTASWDGELVEVSDDSPSVANVTVPTYQAQVFVQASIAALQDIAGLQSDVLMMFGDARDRLEGAAHATGSGSAQPTGIFTALDANTNVELTSTTAATIGLVDLQLLYRSVPIRFRGRSKWCMNPLYLGQVQALGSTLGASYSTNITEAYTSEIFKHGVVESDDAPTTQTTTVRDNEILFGDFSNFLIVDKPGSFSVDYIPNMFNTANNLPDGRRGWFGYWRTGSDSVNDVAFRLLQDKTSA